jgi:hypothetical protein
MDKFVVFSLVVIVIAEFILTAYMVYLVFETL